MLALRGGIDAINSNMPLRVSVSWYSTLLPRKDALLTETVLGWSSVELMSTTNDRNSQFRHPPGTAS